MPTSDLTEYKANVILNIRFRAHGQRKAGPEMALSSRLFQDDIEVWLQAYFCLMAFEIFNAERAKEAAEYSQHGSHSEILYALNAEETKKQII